ncbi:MAG: winged helix-turn-helix domain-containing protein [Kofleriaceae bacterium]|nr:winged helix-turn-helix domain-containing protein [Kofleriaceae bacterium]MBP9168337.1 winged helix-turn-helix domain-containing protein [Kofleriaceae bacterium]MBP9857216.1 winged helix-turn-helix domain-containing protein [Kofleriaceae bacterium]
MTRRRTTLKPPARQTAGAPPFFGRVAELASLREALAVAPVVVLHGALGAGKTALARHLVAGLEVEATTVPCFPGERATAVRARVERRLRCPPGGLAELLATEVRVVVVDDLHHVVADEAARLVVELAPPAGALGRLLVIARDRPVLPSDLDCAELELGGLAEEDAAVLWRALADGHGPAGTLGAALLRTRGLPLALRAEYARGRFGADAWNIARLTPAARRALAILAVLRVPATPAAIAALSPELELEDALAELTARQLIDGDGRGAWTVHQAIEGDALASLEVGDRITLERAAAALLAPGARDGGAIAGLDAVDRLRESALHALAAGDVAAAAALVEREGAIAARVGAGGEIESVIAAIGVMAAPRLGAIQVELAARAGRIAEANERIAAGATGVRPVIVAELAIAALELDVGLARLEALAAEAPILADGQLDRARAIAALVELDLARGDRTAARARAEDSLHEPLGPEARARLLVALAAVDDHDGDPSAVRTALTRAAGALAAGASDEELAAIIVARRAAALVHEGRVAEARAVLDDARLRAGALDAIAVAEAVGESRIALDTLRGDREAAIARGSALTRARRARGDELAALRAEVATAELEYERGDVARATELAHAARGPLTRAGLIGLAERAELVLAAVDLAEVRLERARPVLDRLAGSSALPARARVRAAQLAAEARAAAGQRGGAVDAARDAAPGDDELARDLSEARVATVAGDIGRALAASRRVAAAAERAGRAADLAEALVIGCRLELAKGERAGARAQASRAAREAAAAGLVRPRCHALLALASLARDDDDLPASSIYARDALELAQRAGLPVERLAATIALDSLTGGDPEAGAASGAAAAMTPQAIEAANRLLTDLGLTAVRPFRVIDATGAVSELADADPEVLRLPARTLAVDGVRESIWRRGTELADLRRRSLLKKLLFLFAAAPGRTFSKEDIVQSVWNVAYHPLRHDAALFTNIMRIRRLLGEDGAEIIRVTEDGYRFDPPADFVFVQRAG